MTAVVAVCAWAATTAALAQTCGGRFDLALDVPDGGVTLVEPRSADDQTVLRSVVADADGTVQLALLDDGISSE